MLFVPPRCTDILFQWVCLLWTGEAGGGSGWAVSRHNSCTSPLPRPFVSFCLVQLAFSASSHKSFLSVTAKITPVLKITIYIHSGFLHACFSGAEELGRYQLVASQMGFSMTFLDWIDWTTPLFQWLSDLAHTETAKLTTELPASKWNLRNSQCTLTKGRRIFQLLFIHI